MVPMRIRLRYKNGYWHAYFNGWPTSYTHSEKLEWMCNCIRNCFPKGTLAERDY